MSRHRLPSPNSGEGQFAALPETALSVYCGDFNMIVDSQEYKEITEPSEHVPTDNLQDCWRLLNNKTPHEPTCGIFDHQQWQEGPHCRDFFFVSKALADSVNCMQVDTETAASDHQPLVISLK